MRRSAVRSILGVVHSNHEPRLVLLATNQYSQCNCWASVIGQHLPYSKHALFLLLRPLESLSRFEDRYKTVSDRCKPFRCPGMTKRRRASGTFRPIQLKAAEGSLISDLSLLSKELGTMAVCKKCLKGTLQLKMDVLRMGFASKLVLQCSNT